MGMWRRPYGDEVRHMLWSDDCVSCWQWFPVVRSRAPPAATWMPPVALSRPEDAEQGGPGGDAGQHGGRWE